AVNTQNPALLNEAGDLAARGLVALQNWQKPEGLSDADCQKQKAGLSTIFNGAAGSAAMQKKDYPAAQKYLRDAVVSNPTSADDTYSLALAYLSPKPNTDENTLNGLWFIARAV